MKKRQIAQIILNREHLADSLTANRIGEIFSKMDPNTELIDSGYDLSMATLNWCFYNPNYKEVNPGEIIPEIKITEDEDGNIDTVEEPFEKLLTKSNWSANYLQNTFRNNLIVKRKGFQQYSTVETLTLDELKRAKEKLISYMSDAYTYGTSYIQMRWDPTSYEVTIENKCPKFTNVIKSINANTDDCIHEWKEYRGFNEEYKYCTKCDKKKEDEWMGKLL